MVVTMLTCHMVTVQNHMIWLDRRSPILWSLNTSVCASAGKSPFYFEHGHQPRDVASRAMDTTDVPAPSAKWCEAQTCPRQQSARRVRCSEAPTATISRGWHEVHADVVGALSGAQHGPGFHAPIPHLAHGDFGE